MPCKRMSTSSSVSFSPAPPHTHTHKHYTHKCTYIVDIRTHTLACQLIHRTPTEAGKNVSEFGRVDKAISLLVKDLEALYEVLHSSLLLLTTDRVVDWEELLETHSLSTYVVFEWMTV